MKILDTQSGQKLKKVSITLTEKEISQLINDITQMMNDAKIHHMHLSTDDYMKEITTTVYDIQDIKSFDPRSQKLILHNI